MNVNRNPAERWAAKNERRMAGEATPEVAAKPEPKQDVEGAFKTLNDSTAVHRAAYVQRAEEVYMIGLVKMRENLAAAGMDLNKVAPYPNSWRMGRKEYRMAEALHKRHTASFSTTDESNHLSMSGRLDGKLPWIVVEKPDAEPKVRAAARQDANACFDSYLYKLAGKIGKQITGATFTGILWDGCTLSVECTDGEKQTWTTKCIINQSVYGKLFNQWPTRRQA